jgi:predicted DNA-binding transcriptional regulator AlpA
VTSDLIDIPGIAELLGVSVRRARQLAAGKSFPEPVAVLAIGKVWSRQAVESWAATRPGPGRPRKT